MMKPILPTAGEPVPLCRFIATAANFDAVPAEEKKRLKTLATEAGYPVSLSQIASAYNVAKTRHNSQKKKANAPPEQPTADLRIPSRAFMSCYRIVTLAQNNMSRFYQAITAFRQATSAELLNNVEEFLDDRIPEIDALMKENERLRRRVMELEAKVKK